MYSHYLPITKVTTKNLDYIGLIIIMIFILKILLIRKQIIDIIDFYFENYSHSRFFFYKSLIPLLYFLLGNFWKLTDKNQAISIC